MHNTNRKGAINYLNLAREILQKNELTRINDSDKFISVEEEEEEEGEQGN